LSVSSFRPGFVQPLGKPAAFFKILRLPIQQALGQPVRLRGQNRTEIRGQQLNTYQQLRITSPFPHLSP
jgi:hypothetical protein